MAKVIFGYNGQQIAIQCDLKDIIKDIIKKFFIKSQINDDINLFYLYDGNRIDENLSLEQIIKKEDKEKKELNILIEEQPEDSILLLKNKYKTEDILCPKCGENILLRIKDYKINLYNCKNGHNIENILLTQFNDTKLIEPTNTLCSGCKKKNINNSYNNKINKCLTCQIILCPFCTLTHDKNHKIIDFKERNLRCNYHNEDYIKYCTKCKLNICMACEEEHKNHKVIYFGDILTDKEKIKNDINEIKSYIEKFKGEIDNIISKLNEIKNNIEIYFNICNEVVNDYETKNRNYELLMNIKELEKYKLDLFKDIDKIINDDNIFDKFNDLMNIGFKMNNQNNIKKSEKDKKIEKLNNKIVILENDIKENKEKIKDFNNKNDNLKNELENKKTEISNLESNLKKKEEELSKLNSNTCYPVNNSNYPNNYQQPYYGNQQIYQGNNNYPKNNIFQPNYNYQGDYNYGGYTFGTQSIFPGNSPVASEEEILKFHEHPMKNVGLESIIYCCICHYSTNLGFECEKCSLKMCNVCFKIIRNQSLKFPELKHPHNLYIKTGNREQFKCNNCRELRYTDYYFYCEQCKYYKCPIC
jgi:hypothetical protein